MKGVNLTTSDRIFLSFSKLVLVDDPFLSPVLASDDILQKFPRVKIMVGDLDPLLGKDFS
jgi:hypothetical protein